MAIKCCKDCVPPARYPGCHAKCEQYKAEKAKWEEQKQLIRKEQHKQYNKYYKYRKRQKFMYGNKISLMIKYADFLTLTKQLLSLPFSTNAFRSR